MELFWSVFSRIWLFSPNEGNTDQSNSEYGHFLRKVYMVASIWWYCAKYCNSTLFLGVEILWEGAVFVEFWVICPKLSRNCAFPQSFHTKKSFEITAFYAVLLCKSPCSVQARENTDIIWTFFLQAMHEINFAELTFNMKFTHLTNVISIFKNKSH